MVLRRRASRARAPLKNPQRGDGNHTPTALVRPRVNLLTRSKWQSQFIHIEANTSDINNIAIFLAKA